MTKAEWQKRIVELRRRYERWPHNISWLIEEDLDRKSFDFRGHLEEACENWQWWKPDKIADRIRGDEIIVVHRVQMRNAQHKWSAVKHDPVSQLHIDLRTNQKV